MECDGQFKPSSGSARQASWQSAVEERLRTLETQQRLFNASVKGGAIVVYDDDGNQVGRLGVGTFNSSVGIRNVPALAVNNPSTNGFHLLIDSEEGWSIPLGVIPWQEDSFRPVTNGSFVNVYKGDAVVTAAVLDVIVLVGGDPSTTGEIRLTANGTSSAAISIPASSLVEYLFRWDLTQIGIDLGDFVDFRLQARRVSGTGNINVYAPDNTTFRPSSARPNASGDGIPL